MKRGLWVMLTGFLFLCPAARAATDATIALTFDGFSEPNNFQPNTPFTYKLQVTQPTAEGILAVSVKLTFDPNFIHVVDTNGSDVTAIPSTDFVAPFANCTGLTGCLSNVVDNAAGTMTVGAFWDPGAQATEPKPPATIFKIHFKGIQGTGNSANGGNVSLDIANSELVTDDGVNTLDYPNSTAGRTLNGASSGTVTLKTFLIAPTAPTGLAWTNNDSTANSSIQLSWNPNPEETGSTITYKIYRTDKPGILDTTPPGITTYNDTTNIEWLSSATTFTYQVSAVLNTLEGPKSAQVVAGPDTWPPTPTPSSVTVIKESVTDRSCPIEWQNDEKTVKAQVKYAKTGFDVDTCSSTIPAECGTTPPRLGAAGSTKSSVTVTQLAASTTYQFKVQATDRAGNTLGFLGQDGTPAGTPFTCQTSDQPPTKPTLSSAQCTADTAAKTLNFTWTTNIDADSQVCISTTATSSTKCSDYVQNGFSLSDPSPTTSHAILFTDGATDENSKTIALPLGTNFSYLILSNSLPGDPTACGGSPCEGRKTGTCQFGEALAVTQGPSATTTTTSATVTWTTNKNADSKVIFGTSSTTLDQSAVPSPNDPVTSHTVAITGLQNDTLYFYQVISTTATETTTAPSSPAQFRTQKSITPKGNVSVKVEDDKGSPLLGASVELRDTGGTLIQTGLSDSTGTVLLQSVDIGGYTVSASKTGFSSASSSIQVVQNQTTTTTLTLIEIKALGDLEVTVRNKTTQAPIDGALVSLDPANANPATTGPTGTVLFDNLPAEVAYTITVSKAGFFTKSVQTAGPLPGDTTGTVLTPLTVELEEAATIQGTVVQSTSTGEVPLSGVAVFPVEKGKLPNPCQFIAASDSTGTFTINVPAGSYDIQVLADDLTCNNTLFLGVLNRGFNAPANIDVGSVTAGQVKTTDALGQPIKFVLDPRFIITITPPDISSPSEPITVSPAAVIQFQAEILQGGKAPDPPLTSLKWTHSNFSVGGFKTPDGSIQDEVVVPSPPGNKPTITFVLEGTGTTDISIADINGNTQSKPLINSGFPVRVIVSSSLSVGTISFSTADDIPIGNRPINPRVDSPLKILYNLSQQKPAPQVTVDIFKPDGTLIKELPGNDRFALWDMLDSNGRPVPNGVYLIQIVAQNIGNRATSKIKMVGIFR